MVAKKIFGKKKIEIQLLCLGPEEAKAYSLNILFLGKSNCLIHRMESVLSFWFHQFVIWKQIHRERERDIGVPTFEISESKALALQIHLGWVDMTTSPWTLVPVFPYQCLSCIHRMKGQGFKRERERELYPEYSGIEEGSWARASQAFVLMGCWKWPSLQRGLKWCSNPLSSFTLATNP